MSTLRVHVTRPLPEVALELLRSEGYEVTLPHDLGPPDPVQLKEACRGVHAILSILTESIGPELMDLAPDLKVISNMAVGYDNIDVDAATAREILVCNTPGVLTESTADFAWALILATARRLMECDRFVRDDKFEWWGPQLMLGTDVYGKTLGIIGFGKIGQAVAKRAQGFSMRVLYSGESAPKKSPYGTKVSQDELLGESDFVSLHVPLQTEHSPSSR